MLTIQGKSACLGAEGVWRDWMPPVLLEEVQGWEDVLNHGNAACQAVCSDRCAMRSVREQLASST